MENQVVQPEHKGMVRWELNVQTASADDIAAGLKIVLGQEEWQGKVLTLTQLEGDRLKGVIRLPYDEPLNASLEMRLLRLVADAPERGSVRVRNTDPSFMGSEASDFPTLEFETKSGMRKELLEKLGDFVNEKATLQGPEVQQKIHAIQHTKFYGI